MRHIYLYICCHFIIQYSLMVTCLSVTLTKSKQIQVNNHMYTLKIWAVYITLVFWNNANNIVIRIKCSSNSWSA